MSQSLQFRWLGRWLGIIAASSLFGSLALSLAPQQDKWKVAAQKIKRLPPSAFKEMPPEFQKMLQRRGCLVPQSIASEEPHNVIRGEFARPGQMDWAALCSRKGSSAIVVFWGEASPCPSELADGDDTLSLQDGNDGAPVFSRQLSAVDEKFIRRHFEAYGGPEPPTTIDHHGINDAFVGKASVVHYCHQVKWLRLTGTD